MSAEDDLNDVDYSSNVGPGKEYELCSKNEELVDKLKLLNYEEGFINKQYRPIQRHYFVRSSNVGEQFYLFTTLSGWLIRLAGNDKFEMPQEFDEPNATIGNIMSELRSKMTADECKCFLPLSLFEKKKQHLYSGSLPDLAVGNIQEIVVDFSTNKLRQGSGEHVLHILNVLADLALIRNEFKWERMILPPDEDEDLDVDKEEEDPDTENDDSDPEWADDDDEAELIDLAAPPAQKEQPLQTILISDTDVNRWKHEVEKVTPMLKLFIRQDAKDWRMHLEQMNSFQKVITDLIGQTSPQLEKIQTDLQQSLERIESREKSLNQQMNNVLAKFRDAQDKRAELKEKYKSASGGLNERSEALQRISEDIEQLKQQIEEQGAKASDGAPMVKIKHALAKMEADIDRMNVQVGVLEQGLLNAQLRDRVAFTTEAYAFL